VRIFERGVNREQVVARSKAVGEPPLMLAISVFHAINDAIASLAGGRISPALDAPATPERILFAIEDIRRRAAAAAPGVGIPAAQAAE
jgi:xanthine dehydrogenase large subunit